MVMVKVDDPGATTAGTGSVWQDSVTVCAAVGLITSNTGFGDSPRKMTRTTSGVSTTSSRRLSSPNLTLTLTAAGACTATAPPPAIELSTGMPPLTGPTPPAAP